MKPLRRIHSAGPLIAAGLFAGLLLAGCGASEPEALTGATGTVSVPSSKASEVVLREPSHSGQGECFSDDGYNDIMPGNEVTIRDAAGTIIFTSKLGFGTIDGNQCVYEFSLDGLPLSSDFYSFHVGNAQRGDATLTRDDVVGGVALKVG